MTKRELPEISKIQQYSVHNLSRGLSIAEFWRFSFLLHSQLFVNLYLTKAKMTMIPIQFNKSVLSLGLTLSLLLLSILNLSAQSNSKYFDDDNISTAKNVIKVNLASAYVGDISLTYERFIVEKALSLEAGLGLLMPYYNEKLMGNLYIVDPDGGWSWNASFRWYYFQADQLSLYAGMLYRQRNYNQFGQKATFIDRGIFQGLQFNQNRFVVDLDGGFAFRDVKENGAQLGSDFFDDFVYTITVKVGFLF